MKNLSFHIRHTCPAPRDHKQRLEVEISERLFSCSIFGLEKPIGSHSAEIFFIERKFSELQENFPQLLLSVSLGSSFVSDQKNKKEKKC
jgi:hypothetical protein